MPTFTDLRNFGIKLVDKANEWRIPFQLMQYSSKIDCFVKVHQFNQMNMQRKYVLLFKGDAYEDMEVVINAFSPLGKNSLSRAKDSRQKNMYGRDVYQNVNQFVLYQESAISHDTYDIAKLEREGRRLLNAQEKALKSCEGFDQSTLEQEMESIKKHFRAILAYLNGAVNSERSIHIRRSSGIAHKLKLKPNTGSKKVSFSNILILFGEDSKFPVQAEPGKSKGGGNPSISEQYKTNPAKFKYYDKFGIFEVYDK